MAAVTKDVARADFERVFQKFAHRAPDAGDWNDFENKWRKTHEFYNEQKAYSDDPLLQHERPGVDDEQQRRSWQSLLWETVDDLKVRFAN